MKYFLFIFAFMFASCSMKKEYSLMESPYEVSIPEENREKYQQFIINTVSAASYHMSGGDYEDPEDVIESAERIAKKMYGVPVLVLCKRSSGVCEYMYNKTPAEMYIQDSLIREFKKGKVR